MQTKERHLHSSRDRSFVPVRSDIDKPSALIESALAQFDRGDLDAARAELLAAVRIREELAKRPTNTPLDSPTIWLTR